MPCPACIVALMGDNPPEPASMTTGAKIALAGAGLLAAWLVFFPWTPGSMKRNPKKRKLYRMKQRSVVPKGKAARAVVWQDFIGDWMGETSDGRYYSGPPLSREKAVAWAKRTAKKVVVKPWRKKKARRR